MRMTGRLYDFEFTDDYCLFGGYSGVGKTRLRRFIADYCYDNQLRFIQLVDGANDDINDVRRILTNASYECNVLFLDDADNYMNPELELLIYKIRCLKIIVLRNHKIMPYLSCISPGLYDIVYQDKKING